MSNNLDFDLSPPSIKHLPEKFNNQELFNSWWNWRILYYHFGGKSVPPQFNIKGETYKSRQERLTLWRQIADKTVAYIKS